MADNVSKVLQVVWSFIELCFKFAVTFFNWLIHSIGVMLEIILYAIPINIFFLFLMYLYWHFILKKEAGYKHFIFSEKLVKITFVIINISIVILVLLKNDFFSSTYLYFKSVN
ncbi:MAG: hypothetical protein UT66_C0022G0019 [candidate division CPR2 bacterium GW2011_GWC1_39_9]|uniref:Uncharacterized protein n=1 Tax=candidate division CPR2 bacterium GW2011_GWC2_39_10 TaxID=1618345 RepID=A0A0G0PZK7_UNCC2|nr:MAG: hypothetical protein UT18_C0007G0117 [candidate division CPR2 bacterium GW2011_GWC2_39_10]KKR34526.1 MAG: hypothetical protein UT66_C0022G0019 [candidate division CPR2 bacterium GW2011_GWC1_39_9]